MKTFKIDEDCSVSWTWGGVWYTMTMADSRKLEKLYTGGHPHGATHEEKLELIAQHKWATCKGHGTTTNVRSPS